MFYRYLVLIVVLIIYVFIIVIVLIVVTCPEPSCGGGQDINPKVIFFLKKEENHPGCYRLTAIFHNAPPTHTHLNKNVCIRVNMNTAHHYFC